jgi:site-specific recombinase XerD
MERLTPQFIQDFSICFAVLALTKGMPIESVSRILGHTNITTTQIYAKITMQKLNADMDDLEKQLHDLSSHF